MWSVTYFIMTTYYRRFHYFDSSLFYKFRFSVSAETWIQISERVESVTYDINNKN